MSINFSNIKLEVIDITTNTSPDIFINNNCINFTKRVLEDLNYPLNVQFCLDATNKIFAIRYCKANEAKAVPFSKSRTEQTSSLNITNKNLRDIIIAMIPGSDNKTRYKVTGEYDIENRIMYFDMTTAKECNYRNN